MNRAKRLKLEKAWSILEEVLQEEQECFDNLPESLQCSDKGEMIGENIDDLTTIDDYIRSIIER